MALHEPQTGDRIIGPFRSVACSTHRGHLQPRIIEPPEVLALSPERGAVSGSLRRFLSGSNDTLSAAVNGYPAA
jgi:hypothetical protein